jgi:hypothetical protein
MPTWPKLIYIKGVGIPVDSWDEMDEVIARYGAENIGPATPEGSEQTPRRTGHLQGVNPSDRSLLESFVEAGDRGVLTARIGQALGKRGKGVRNALDAWSRRIGLVTESGASAFESVKRFDGRGFRMVDHYIGAARQMLGR